MLRRVIVLALLAPAACTSVDHRVSSYVEPRVETRDFRSGTRLVAQAWAIDGALVLRNFYDTEREEACSFDEDVAHVGPDRSHWCLPLGMAVHSPKDGPFAEASCTTPLALAPGVEPATYALVDTANACAASPEVHRVGESKTTRPWFKDGASCVRSSQEFVTQTMGDVVPRGQFVRGDEWAEERGSRIASFVILTPDGARQTIGGFDLERREPVRIEQPTNGPLRWAPSRVAFLGAQARFTDASCKAPVPTKTAANATCPLTAIAAFTGTCADASYYTLGSPLDATTLFELADDGSCIRNTSTDFAFELGARIPDEAIAPASMTETGSGYIRRRGYSGPGGSVATWGDVIDVRTREPCTPMVAVDGFRRCLPTAGVSLDYFADDTCETPAFTVPSDPCLTPLGRFVRVTSAEGGHVAEVNRVFEVVGDAPSLFTLKGDACVRDNSAGAGTRGFAVRELDVAGFVPVDELDLDL